PNGWLDTTQWSSSSQRGLSFKTKSSQSRSRQAMWSGYERVFGKDEHKSIFSLTLLFCKFFWLFEV
ncbi:MAG: hypothetical protein AAF639_47345, partial [Chloroflexota bacterium]